MANGGTIKRRRKRRKPTARELIRLRNLRRTFGLGEFRGRGSPGRRQGTPRSTPVARGSRPSRSPTTPRQPRSNPIRALVDPFPQT